MYNTSTGLIVGIVLSLTLNTLLGVSIKNYSPPPIKERKKYENVKMKINKIKKEPPKIEEPKIEEVKKEEPKKEEPKKIEPKKEIKKVAKKKEIPKKEEPKKEIPKNPINEKKEVKEEQKEVKKTSTPVFGVSMNTVSGSGGGTFQVQVGNTLMTDYKTGWENGKPKDIGVYDGSLPAPKKEVAIVKAPPLKIKEKAVPKKVVRPSYTKAAKDAEIEGSIVLKLEIDKTGVVTNAKIIKGLGFGLDEEALKAVKAFTFTPAILSNGEKTASIITYTINFVLQN